jgi:hypothetical protein
MSSRTSENFDSKFSDYVNDFKKHRQAMSTNTNYDDRRSQATKSDANNDIEMKITSGRYPPQMPHYNNPYSLPQQQQQQQQQFQHQMPSYPLMNPSNQYGAPPPHHPPQFQRHPPNYPNNNNNNYNENDALAQRREHEFFVLGNEIDFIIWLLQRLFEKKIRDNRTRMYLSGKLREMLTYWESTNFGV